LWWRLQKLLLRGLHGQPHRLLLIHAFPHEGKLAHLALLLSLLCEVAEVVLGVVPLLLGVDGLLCLLLLLFFLPLILFFLLLLHRCEQSNIDELIVAKEPFSAPWIPFEVDEGVSHWRVNDVRGVSEEVWR
jgi:hypothetical protein